MNVAATMTLTPGTVISRLTSGQDSASAAMSCSTAAISVSRKSTWRSAGVDGLALADRQLLLGQPAAALDAEQVRGGRAVLQAAHQHRVDLVLGARARADELRAAREPAPHRADALVRRPDAVELAGPQQLGQRPGVEAVGLRSRLADAGVARRDDDHPRDMRLEDPRRSPTRCRSPPARPSRARRGSARTAPTLRAVPRSGPPSAAGPPRRSPPRRSRDEHPARPLAPAPPRRRRSGEPVGKRHRRIRARSATGQVAGAATEKPGLEAHRPKRPAQPAFSRRPLSQSAEPKPAPRTTETLQRAVSCPDKRHSQQAPAKTPPIRRIRAASGRRADRLICPRFRARARAPGPASEPEGRGVESRPAIRRR